MVPVYKKGHMAKNNHHFVPKLYLKAFQSAEKRIHLYNLNKSLVIKDASLRDQCRARRLHGPTDHVENMLSSLENDMGPALRQIVTEKTLPAMETEAYEIVLAFVALQILRTPVTANRINVSVDKMTKQAYSHDPRLAAVDMEGLQIGYDNPVLASLSRLPHVIYSMLDLNAHLIFSPTNLFLTSDNPAVKYNQYCEEIQYAGITGMLNRGLQIFLPLAPHLELMLYDPAIYSVRTQPSARFSVATQNDVHRMNLMQLISADENVYFSDWRQVENVRQLAAKTSHHRKGDRVTVQEYGQDDDSNSSLLHAFERTPCLKLELSLLRVKRNARRVQLHERVHVYRKKMPMPPLPEPPNLKGRTVTFSRFIGRR